MQCRAWEASPWRFRGHRDASERIRAGKRHADPGTATCCAFREASLVNPIVQLSNANREEAREKRDWLLMPDYLKPLLCRDMGLGLQISENDSAIIPSQPHSSKVQPETQQTGCGFCDKYPRIPHNLAHTWTQDSLIITFLVMTANHGNGKKKTPLHINDTIPRPPCNRD